MYIITQIYGSKLNKMDKYPPDVNDILHVTADNFEATALAVFRFQYDENPVYRQFCELNHIHPDQVTQLRDIPFLPISFFKSHLVASTSFEPEAVFESSGTTQTINSRHAVKSLDLYRKSFQQGFQRLYGSPTDWCILALLPSYLERNNSSLVLMADDLIHTSGHPNSGFYLNQFEALQNTLAELEAQSQPTLLLGVTFALLDLAAQYPMTLRSTIVMETGGMKGRRKEMTRKEVHEYLCSQFQTNTIHSEYGMTELLSQAYSSGNGIFTCPPWMKVLAREEDDPKALYFMSGKSGALNVIDLCNLYSCSFIATDDAVTLHDHGRFEVSGRLDNSDIRGCSLMTI